MTEGKTHHATVKFAIEMLPNPRKLGHDGVLIRHLSFDKGAFSANVRRLRQWFTKDLLDLDLSASDVPRLLMFLLDWVVATPCSLHGVHKAFFWGLA